MFFVWHSFNLYNLSNPLWMGFRFKWPSYFFPIEFIFDFAHSLWIVSFTTLVIRKYFQASSDILFLEKYDKMIVSSFSLISSLFFDIEFFPVFFYKNFFENGDQMDCPYSWCSRTKAVFNRLNIWRFCNILRKTGESSMKMEKWSYTYQLASFGYTIREKYFKSIFQLRKLFILIEMINHQNVRSSVNFPTW